MAFIRVSTINRRGICRRDVAFLKFVAVASQVPDLWRDCILLIGSSRSIARCCTVVASKQPFFFRGAQRRRRVGLPADLCRLQAAPGERKCFEQQLSVSVILNEHGRLAASLKRASIQRPSFAQPRVNKPLRVKWIGSGKHGVVFIRHHTVTVRRLGQKGMDET